MQTQNSITVIFRFIFWWGGIQLSLYLLNVTKNKTFTFTKVQTAHKWYADFVINDTPLCLGTSNPSLYTIIRYIRFRYIRYCHRVGKKVFVGKSQPYVIYGISLYTISLYTIFTVVHLQKQVFSFSWN